MKRAILWCVLLASAMTVQAQQPQSPVLPLDRAGAGQVARPQIDPVVRPDDPIAPSILERFRVHEPALPSGAAAIEPDLQRQVADAQAPAAQPASSGASRESATVSVGAVIDRAGAASEVRVVRSDQSVEAPTGRDELVTLRRGDVLAVRRDEPVQPVTEPDGVVTAPSPTILYTLDDTGRTRELGIVHRSAGLFWQPDRGRFAGELLIGVLDRQNPAASGPLGAAVPIQLLAAPGSLDQTTLELNTVGLPLRRIAVEVEAPDNPFAIALISQIDLDLPGAALPVLRPQLALTAPDAIQGFGVGEAVVTVSATATPLRPGQALTLALDNGWLADQTVVVGENGTASTRIRSDWMGRGTLRVVAPTIYEAAPKEIRYTAPLRFLLATLAGGMLGALVLVHMLRRKEGPGQSYTRDWVVGLAVGVGTTTMAYAGMKLPEWIPLPATLAGEVAPFALSFICATAGTALIHSITGGAAPAD